MPRPLLYVIGTFFGTGFFPIAPATVAKALEGTDIAPTLSAFVGVKPPSGARGTALTEVTQPRN